MGLFKKLFRQKNTNQTQIIPSDIFTGKEEPVLRYYMDDGTPSYETLRVNHEERRYIGRFCGMEKGFYGVKKYSKNKKYCVVFVPDYNHGSHVVLVNTLSKEILFHNKSMLYPHKVDVSDNGIVVVNDSGEHMKENGIFRCFDSSGNKLFQHEVLNNLADNCLINKAGTRAVFDVCRDWKFYIVDIQNKKVIREVEKEYTTSTEVDIDAQEIKLFYGNSPTETVRF